MQALWSANTSVAHCDAGTMDGGVHLITHDSHQVIHFKGLDVGVLAFIRVFQVRGSFGKLIGLSATRSCCV